MHVLLQLFVKVISLYLLHRVILKYLNFGGNWVPFDDRFHMQYYVANDFGRVYVMQSRIEQNFTTFKYWFNEDKIEIIFYYISLIEYPLSLIHDFV